MFQEFLDGESYILGYLLEQEGRNIAAGMKRDCCTSPVSMPILPVRTALADLDETEIAQSCCYFSRL